MQQWEYISVTSGEPLARDFLNKQGGEGWELVSVAPAAGSFLYVFKRAKANGPLVS